MSLAEQLIEGIIEGLNPGSRRRPPPHKKGDTVTLIWYDGVYPRVEGEGILRSDPKWINEPGKEGWYALIGVKKDFSDDGSGKTYLGKRWVFIFDWSGGAIGGASAAGSSKFPPAWTPSNITTSSWRMNYA